MDYWISALIGEMSHKGNTGIPYPYIGHMQNNPYSYPYQVLHQ